jgi:hypothetical protein
MYDPSSAENTACGTEHFSCACGLPVGRHDMHECGDCGGRWEAATESALGVELSPLQLAVLNAAADAPNVHRPAADFNVGDTVVIAGSGIRNYTDSISKVGRMWITVGEGIRAKRFDISTLRSEHGTGTGYSMRSRAQFAYDLMIDEATEQLRASGLVKAIRTWGQDNGYPVSDYGRIADDVVAAYRAEHDD